MKTKKNVKINKGLQNNIQKIDDNDEDVESDVDEAVHNELIHNIKQLYGRENILPASRSEPSNQVSSFHLKKPEGENSANLKVDDLLNEIKDITPSDVDKVRNIRKRFKPLDPPLEKIHAQKIQREVGFDNVKTKLNKWNEIVTENRLADQLKFPIRKPSVPEYRNYMKDEDIVSAFRNPTPLEKKYAEILTSSKVEQEDRQIEQNDYDLTLTELIHRRKMFAKIRAQASFKIAKAWRQNKIKSKSYHRLLRRERVKKQLEDFESLQKTDPDAVLEQLKQIESARAKERATLRHRNTGRWAQNQLIRAKYNKETRIALSEQMKKNRELTKKLIPVSSDCSDVEDEIIVANENATKSGAAASDNVKNISDVFLNEFMMTQQQKTKINNQGINSNTSIDPDNFLKFSSKNRLNSKIPNVTGGEEDTLDDMEMDDDDSNHHLISEAFADDDLIAEFREEKQKTLEEALPKDILSAEMPGWGSWTGTGIEEDKIPKKKRRPFLNKRLLFKIPAAPPRKDCNKGRVIIREEKEPKMRKLMVNELPYPYKSVKDFESSIKAPIGRDWVPEVVHQELIAPSIVTTPGAIIEPMDGTLVQRKRQIQINR